MIENFQFQPTSELNSGGRMEKMDSQEGMIGMGLTSTFHTILMQCSPQIFKVSIPLRYCVTTQNSSGAARTIIGGANIYICAFCLINFF